MIAVLGVGNLLMRDDGVGVHVAQALARGTLPPGVEVIDGGTAPDAAHLAAPHRRVIVVDAARGGGAPGTIYRFTTADVARRPGVACCHDAGAIAELAAVAEDDGREIVIIGVEPEEIGWGMSLSPTIAARLDAVVVAVRQEIESGGVHARNRAQTD